LDLRDNSRQLVIQKDGLHQVIFNDFTSPTTKPHISASQLEKICRGDNLGYIMLINAVHNTDYRYPQEHIHHTIEAVLQHFEDVFAEQTSLPPQRDCDHEIPLIPGSKPPNARPYRVPHTQKDEVERLI
jgi:hypothetical protein